MSTENLNINLDLTSFSILIQKGNRTNMINGITFANCLFPTHVHTHTQIKTLHTKKEPIFVLV